jgi:hypothetical protein
VDATESRLARGNAKYNEDEQRFDSRVRRTDDNDSEAVDPVREQMDANGGSGVGANKRGCELNIA